MTYGTVVACLLVSLPLCRYVFVEDPRGISLFLLPTHPYSPAVLTDQPDNRASRWLYMSLWPVRINVGIVSLELPSVFYFSFFFLCRRQSQEKERRKKRWRFLSSEIETIPRVEGEVRWLALFKHAIKMTQIWNYWYTFFFLTWWIGGRRYENFPWASTAPSNILFRSIVMQLTQSSRQKLGDTLDPSVQLWVVWPVDGLFGPGLYAEVGQKEKNSFQFEILTKSPSGRFWSS